MAALTNGGGGGSTATPDGTDPEGGGRSTLGRGEGGPEGEVLPLARGGGEEPPARWLSTPRRTAATKEGKGAPSRPEVAKPGGGPRGAEADELAAGIEQGEAE